MSKMARACAMVHGRDYVIPEDVQAVFSDVCAHRVILTGVGIYSRNTNVEADKIRQAVEEIVLMHEWALQMHGFYLDDINKVIRFDVVLSFDITHAEGIRILSEEIKAKFPEYEPLIVADIDITD